MIPQAEPTIVARRPRSFVCRLAGMALLVITLMPLHRLLASERTGLAGRATIEMADIAWELMWVGMLMAALSTVLFARLLPERLLDAVSIRAVRVLAQPTPRQFAALAALIAGGLTLIVTFAVFAGLPQHPDSLVQILHARVLADGSLAAPTELLAFWMVQNSVPTVHGWVSQYPPGHAAVLAAGLLAGVPWLVGALLVATTAYATARFADAELPAYGMAPRAGVLLFAVSPFVLGLGASYMNHVTAAAGCALAAWLLVRAREGSAVSAAGAGVALGIVFATRPLVALAVGGTLCAGLLGRQLILRRRVLLPLLGGLVPPVALLLAWNTRFFGSPFRFGYDVALGPAAGLGFGTDPWGNAFGPVEAIGYTTADLLSLNSHLLESPLPVMVVIGLFLTFSRRLDPPIRVLAAWALVPIVAHAFYWHHGHYMGPRMLYETAPAWVLLFVLAARDLLRSLPRRVPRHPGFALRNGFAATLAISVGCGILVFGPQRMASYHDGLRGGTVPPEPAVSGIVFVHEAWRSRVAMRLAADGMRLDSVEAVIGGNSTCDAQRLADARATGNIHLARSLVSGMNMSPTPAELPLPREIAPGSRAVVLPGEIPGPVCMREARSDRAGTLDLTSLVWRGGRPGDARAHVIYVRDLGPERNAAIMAQHASRRAHVYAAVGDQPRLYTYDEGMRLLWESR